MADSLLRAAKAKEDEFYTRMEDISAELKHYKQHFKGKTVFCNCDDPYESNFFKYFALYFNYLGLKKLIATCYDGSPFAGSQLRLSLYERDARDEVEKTAEETVPKETLRIAHKIVITEVPDLNGDGAIDQTDVEWLLRNGNNVLTKLKGNGDFRSEECVELLKEADIVVTNPPFSLFIEYVELLLSYNKKFIIIGNQNDLTGRTIFRYFKNNYLWAGYKCGDMSFRVPDYYQPRKTRYWVDETGQKWRSHGNIMWYTNIDHIKRHHELDVYKKYTPEEYPKYDNCDAIEVSKVADIPIDYDGIMGVPVTFLDKYCPEQYEIIGNEQDMGLKGRCKMNGKYLYARIFIRKKERQA